MPKTEPFDSFAEDYDSWFARNPEIHAREIQAVKTLLPGTGCGLEVGVGSGQFAVPLGIKNGIDPSSRMAGRSSASGIRVIRGVAEELPVSSSRLDFLLMVTVICFVDDIERVFNEAFRVLRPGGALVVAFIDRDSELGRIYGQNKKDDRFYSAARFFSSREVLDFLGKAGFEAFSTRQTILPDDDTIDIKEGFGEGSFVAIRGIKPAGRPSPGKG